VIFTALSVEIITFEDMGKIMSIFLHPKNNVIIYKCPSSPDFDFYEIDQFLYKQEQFIILSDPYAEIITIEESDYGYY
jgi:hypothetical protein